MRKLIVLLLFISYTISTQAQLYLGFKSGYSNSYTPLSGSKRIKEAHPFDKHAHGVNSAFTLYYKIGRLFQIGIEPAFVQRGSICSPCTVGKRPVHKYNMTLNYMELPFMLKLDFPFDKKRMSIDLKAGYSLSYLQSANIRVRRTEGEAPEPAIQLGSIEFDGFVPGEHGAHFGIGTSRKLTERGTLFFDASYYHGIGPLGKWVYFNKRSLNFAVGYRVELKGKS